MDWINPQPYGANMHGDIDMNGPIPDVSQLRIPLQYLANLLTAGDIAPVKSALERLLSMRAWMRFKTASCACGCS